MNFKTFCTAAVLATGLAATHASAATTDILDAGLDSTGFPYMGTLTLDATAVDTAAFDDTSSRFTFQGNGNSSDMFSVDLVGPGVVLTFGNLVSPLDFTKALVHVDGNTIDLLGTGNNVFVEVGVVSPIDVVLDFEGTGSYDFQLRATPVPVPAGIVLMGTAIAGFGVMRRRKKTTA